MAFLQFAQITGGSCFSITPEESPGPCFATRIEIINPHSEGLDFNYGEISSSKRISALAALPWPIEETDPSSSSATYQATALVVTAAKAAGVPFDKFLERHPILKTFCIDNVLVSDPFSYMRGTPLEKAAPQATLEPRVSGGRDAMAVDDAAVDGYPLAGIVAVVAG